MYRAKYCCPQGSDAIFGGENDGRASGWRGNLIRFELWYGISGISGKPH